MFFFFFFDVSATMGFLSPHRHPRSSATMGFVFVIFLLDSFGGFFELSLFIYVYSYLRNNVRVFVHVCVLDGTAPQDIALDLEGGGTISASVNISQYPRGHQHLFTQMHRAMLRFLLPERQLQA